MTARHDRALRAVERVRSLREQAAQRDLAHANRELADAQALLGAARAGMDDIAERTMPTSAGELLVRLAQAELSRDTIALTQAGRDSAQKSSYVATQQWTSRKADLKAIENLLERRAEARATERRHAEVKEIDEMAQRITRGTPPDEHR